MRIINCIEIRNNCPSLDIDLRWRTNFWRKNIYSKQLSLFIILYNSTSGVIVLLYISTVEILL